MPLCSLLKHVVCKLCVINSIYNTGAFHQKQQDQPRGRFQADAQRRRCRIPVERERHQRPQDRSRDGH